MLRNIALLLFASIGLLLLRDVVFTYHVYLKIEKSVEQGLDAAIVASSEDADNQRGGLKINMPVANEALKEALILNMDLNSKLESDIMQESSLHANISYHGKLPRLEARFDTKIELVTGKWLGLPAWPLMVKKHTPYLAEFI